MAPSTLRQTGNTSALEAPVAIKMTHLLYQLNCMEDGKGVKKQIALIRGGVSNSTTEKGRYLALTTGKVSVILLDGGLGESSMGAQSFLVSISSLCPGKREQVCPSGPIPRRTASNTGTPSAQLELSSFCLSSLCRASTEPLYSSSCSS